MFDSNLKQILTDVGLSDNQASVYLASLALGPTTPVKIANAAGIKRTTVYPVIESLQRTGLMNIEIRGLKKQYFAESPDKLESIVEMRHQQLKKSLGSLSALHNLKSGESSIKYFDGVDSVKTVYNSLLDDIEAKQDYLIISSPQEWFELDPDFFKDFIDRRSKLDIKIRSLLLDSKIARDYKDNERNYNLKAKILPKNISFKANIVIIPKKIMIHQLVPPIWAIIIENQYIVETHQQFFEMMWGIID